MIQNILDWHLNNNYGPAAQEHLGKLPLMLDPSKDEAPDAQLDPFWTRIERDAGWILSADDYLMGPQYPPQAPAAAAAYPGGVIFAYPHRFVAIVLNDGQFLLGRLHD